MSQQTNKFRHPSPSFQLSFTHLSPFAPLSPIFRSPVQAGRVNPNLSLSHGSSVSIKNFFWKIQNVLSFVVVDDSKMLKGWHNIFLSYTGHFTDVTVESKQKQITCDNKANERVSL